MSRIIVILLSILFGLPVGHPAHAQPTPVDTQAWAFCGVHPDAPHAQATASALHWSGIDATMGPCMPPDWSSYTPSNPGQRYVDPDTYLRLVAINHDAGMKTIVYDARLWSDDPAVRAQGIATWQPVVADIAAFDMGDEFDPKTPEWAVLVHRWQIMVTDIAPVLGVQPYTNHLADTAVLDRAVVDLPGATLSFDSYTQDAQGIPQDTLALARQYDGQASNLMCAVDALPFTDHSPTWNGIASSMWLMRFAGCDSFLIFGGVQPYGADLSTGDPYFGPSLDAGGWPSALGFGVKIGSL